MQPVVHVAVAGVVTAATFHFVNVTEAAGFFLASSLLDVDHLAYYVIRFCDVNPRRAVAYFRSIVDIPRTCLCACHTLEFVAALGILALVISSRVLMACFTGVLVHLALDLLEGISMRRLSYRWWSIVDYVIQARKARKS